MKIRHEINIINRTVTNWTNSNLEELIYVDPSNYNGSFASYLEIVGNDGDAGDTCRLQDPGDFSHKALAIPTTWARGRSGIGTELTADEYHLNHYDADVDNIADVSAARLIIIQDTGTDPLTASETQIEIGNYELEIFNNSGTDPLANPKYFYFDSSNWDGTIEIYGEVVWSVVNNKYSLTVYIQEDDGSFGNWTNVSTVLNAGTSETVTRTRGSDFFSSLTSGRNYRLAYSTGGDKASYGANIFCAKLIVRQIPPTTEVTHNFNTDTSISDTAGSRWVSGSFQTGASGFDLYVAKLYIGSTGSPGGSLSVDIYSATGTPGNPNTSLGSSTNSYDTGDGLSNHGRRNFFFNGITLSANTHYFFVVKSSQDNDGSNYFRVYYNTSGSNSIVKTDDSPVSWTSIDSSAELDVRVYSGNITKLEEQYLLLNTGSATTGLQDMDSLYDADEWDGVTVDLYPEHDASGSSSNTKIQEDVDGTPSDVANSSITGANRTRGGTALSITDDEDIDTYIVTA